MYQKKQSNNLWYTRNKSGVKGPFTTGMIQGFVLIGRLKMDDQVSPDKKEWQSVEATKSVIPEEMRDIRTDDDRQRLLQAQLREDERSKDRRRAELGEFQGRREKNDRRSAEDFHMRAHRESRNDAIDDYVTTPSQWVLRAVLGLMLTALLVVAVYVFVEQDMDANNITDCNQVPAPGVNWENCQFEGAQLAEKNLQKSRMRNINFSAADLAGANLKETDLAYAQFSVSHLLGADMSKANLKGANLKNSDLRQVNFTGADLSYADLRGAVIRGAIFKDAILYKAIWTNGKVCSVDSIGICTQNTQK